MKRINKKLWISFVLTMSLLMASMTVNAASLSDTSDASSDSSSAITSLRIPSSQTNTVPDPVTESYQTYENKKASLTEEGWTVSEEHLNAETDVYWLEGKTAEGAYYRYFSYDGSDDSAQILASSANVTWYSDLNKYWMDESTYSTLLATGILDKMIGYAEKRTVTDGELTTTYVGYVYYYPAS